MGIHKQTPKDFSLRTGISPEDIALLRSVPLFSGIAPNELRHILSTSSIRRYPNHTTLFMEGEPADRFYVITKGWVKLSRMCENGNEVVISVTSIGDSFAEAAIFEKGEYSVTATTITDARLLVVNSSTLMAALRENSELLFNMMVSLSRDMHKNQTLLHQLCAMSATERLAAFLMNLCPSDAGKIAIPLPIDKALIAMRLGMKPETLSRAFAKLKRVGIVTSGRNVLIEDVSRFRRVYRQCAVDPGAYEH